MTSSNSNRFEFTDDEIREGLMQVLQKSPDKKWEEQELMDAVDDYLVRKTIDDSLERLIEIGYIKKAGADKKTGEDTYTLTKKGEKYYREINKKQK